MLYPTLKEQVSSRKIVDTFKGYNHNLRISDGEFYEMQNMTSDYYPVLSPRKNRGKYEHEQYSVGSIRGVIAQGSLVVVDGTDVYINGNKVPGFSVSGDTEVTMVSMGAYVLFFPEKKYLNTVPDIHGIYESGSIDAEYHYQGDDGSVWVYMCYKDGTFVDLQYKAPVAPENPKDGEQWLDTTEGVVKKWSESLAMWVIVETYVQISAEGIQEGFSEGDGVFVNLFALKDHAKNRVNGGFIISAIGTDYIVVNGKISEVGFEVWHLDVMRNIPEMDFIIEAGNRLWGCRFGDSSNGERVNEIYASKLGDFKNWNTFAGISTDSYAASVGSDGPFTGAIAHMGHPLFFKEDCVHKVYGNYPANFQIQETALRGVQEGCAKSLAIVNNVLYYRARDGICAYDGAFPVDVSYAFCNAAYNNAVAGGIGNKYYISMQDEEENCHLFVYDTAKQMWHREDDFHAKQFCSYKGELYGIDENNQLITMRGTMHENEEEVEWFVETGEMMLTSPDMKYISRLTVRMSLDIGATVDFEAQYDLSDEWVNLCHMEGTSLRSFSVPIRPRRCDYMKLRIAGSGVCKIYSITKTIEQGSELS